MSQNLRWSQAAAFTAGTACLALTAHAQSLITTHGRVLAANDGQVPGVAAGILYGGSSTFDSPVIDENGVILFRGRMTDISGMLGVTPLNDRALFRGTTMADLTIVARGSDPAPGLPGVTMNSGTSTQMGGNVRLSPDGDLFFGAPLSGAVTTTTDTALFGGPFGSLGVLVREGDQCPGAMAGTALSSAFSGPSQQPTGLNRNGRMLFQSATLGGDTVTTNNAVWITGTAGNLEQVIRKGDTVLGGPVVSALGFISQMNDSGQVLHEETLSTTLGSPPATAADDKVLFVFTPGSGNAVVVREGDPAPGTASASFNLGSNAWSVNTGANTFNSSGQTILNCDLFSGDVVTGVNDRGVYVGGTGGLTLALRRGDPGPIAGTTIDSVNNASMCINNAGRICFQAVMIGGGVTTADDGVILSGPVGSLQLVVREGDPAPGTVGATIQSFVSNFMTQNERGQILFTCTLAGGDTTTSPANFSAYYLWDPMSGLHLVWRGNDPIEVAPTVIRNSSSFGSSQFNNGDANPLAFNALGQIATKITMTDGTSAIMIIEPPDTVTSFCFGDGLDVSHTTPCPCGNNGAPGNGCRNSVNVNGAHLSTHGHPFTDDLVLDASGMPDSSTCIYLQGDLVDDATFGDGVRCVGGTLLRLRAVGNVGGASSFPDSTETITLSARGGVVPLSGARRLYQTYYRNAAAAFCPPDTFNVTNGLDVTW